jgi:ribonuclease HI
MMITIFADASFCPKTGAAGWGSWAIRDGWQRGKFHGGPLRREISSSNTAELCGIASALWKHNRDGDLDEVKSFMLQCDNVTALGFILGKISHARPSRLKGERNAPVTRALTNNKLCLEALTVIKDIVGKRGVLVRHVKGHSGTNTGRAWVNHQCDREARRHMEAMRSEMRVA